VSIAASKDSPNYWTSRPQNLVTECNIGNVIFGNGLSVYQNAIIPQLLAAEYEVILVTCFWARSETLFALNDGLRQLSAKGLRNGKRIRVRICFSSSSLWQKLFHPSSVYVYDAPSWERVGLPRSDELAGLDMHVRSRFVLPFSVFHPKLVIVDRGKVLLPSCNVSWVSVK